MIGRNADSYALAQAHSRWTAPRVGIKAKRISGYAVLSAEAHVQMKAVPADWPENAADLIIFMSDTKTAPLKKFVASAEMRTATFDWREEQ
jgi:hypothetical protein